MKIEILFSEVCNLYGDLGNIKYLEKGFGENTTIIKTSLKDNLKFITEAVDIVYIGSFSEKYYEKIVSKLQESREHIIKKIKEGQIFIATGNAFDLFGKEVILDKRYIDKNFITSPQNKNTLDYYNLCKDLNEHEVLNIDLNKIDSKYKVKGLGMFNTIALSSMLLRQNDALWADVNYADDSFAFLAFKNTFTQSYLINEKLSNDFEQAKYFANVKRGMGLHKDSKFEGIRINNFIATYSLGPLLILNPYFVKALYKKLGIKAKIYLEDDLMDAYNKRLEEFKNPNLSLGNFINNIENQGEK